jgi:hypothetical protein
VTIDHPVVVPVAIMIAILVDDDRIAIPMFVPFADDGTIPISVAIPVMSGADGNTCRSDANANFFRAGGYGCANAGRCGNHDCVFHCVLQIEMSL